MKRRSFLKGAAAAPAAVLTPAVVKALDNDEALTIKPTDRPFYGTVSQPIMFTASPLEDPNGLYEWLRRNKR